jgi:hypothetical protein
MRSYIQWSHVFRLEAAYLNAEFLADYQRALLLQGARTLSDSQLVAGTQRFG